MSSPSTRNASPTRDTCAPRPSRARCWPSPSWWDTSPGPGLAASVWLAYSLQPDPADTAVVLPAGLLAQSVPGTGELPQTFETTQELVARPSWNTLGVRTTGPVTAPNGLSQLTSLAFQGATTGLAANDVILLFDGGAHADAGAGAGGQRGPGQPGHLRDPAATRGQRRRRPPPGQSPR